MSKPTKIVIFLSSPTDVQPEREAAERVVARLSGVYAAHVDLSLERWERRYYEASKGFQETIANMDTFDLVVGILWKRIGSELPPERFFRPDGSPFESGTVYELETALFANRRSGRPTVYVFKSTRAVTYTAERVDEERVQKEALDGWWAHTFRDEGGHYIAATNSFANTEDFEIKFENCLVSWLEERGCIPSGPVWDVATRGSPYPGLVAYNRDRSSVFFGRQLVIEQAYDELLAAITREGGLPAIFIIGASGSGKSSLVRAGLVPRLTQPGAVAGVDLWRTVVTVPGADSLALLATCLYMSEGLPELGAGAQSDPARWARMAAGSPEAAADTIVWALNRIAEFEIQRVQPDRKLEVHLLLVVDQLESLFGTTGQSAFNKVLRAFVNSGRVWLLATLRSDRYQELQLDPDLLLIKRAGATYDLPPPGSAEISDMVKGPARAGGLIFEEREGKSLAHVLIQAVPNADALPLLQMALAQLFEKRDGVELTYAAYEAISGIEGAIASHANTVFASVPLLAQREFDPLVQALVRDVARGSDGQIRFTTRTADRKTYEVSSTRRNLIEILVNGRLLVSNEGNFRVAHEALLRRWDRARVSLKRLADAELQKARLRLLTAITSATVFLIMGFIAHHETQIARQQESEAKIQRLASEMRYAESLIALGGSLRQSLRLTDAKDRYDEAYRVLGRLAAPTFPADIGLWRTYLYAPPALNTLVEHSGAVYQVAFLPDSRHILSGGKDELLRQWDIATGRMIQTFPHSDSIASIAVSHDGRLAATGTNGGKFGPELRFLDLINGKELHTIRVGDKGEYSLDAVAFMPDSRTVISGHRDGILRVWDAETGHLLHSLQSASYKPAQIFDIAVSPDGRWAVTTQKGVDGPMVWDLKEGKTLRQFKERAGGKPSFSPDGQLVMAVTLGGEVYIWEIETGILRETLVTGADLTSARFLPRESGFLALTGGSDSVLRLWSEDNKGLPVKFFTDHKSDVNNIDVSPDGRFGVSAYDSGSIKIWDLSIGNEFQYLHGHMDGITDLTLSVDGRLALSSSWDQVIRLWDLASGRLIGNYQDQFGEWSAASKISKGAALVFKKFLGEQVGPPGIKAVAFLPDGNSFVSVNTNGSIRVWDVTTGQIVRSFAGHQGVINDVVVSHTGTVASAGFDRTVKLWDPQSGQKLSELPHSDMVLSVAFSQDGNYLYSGGREGLLRQWEWTSEREVKVFNRPDPEVYDATELVREEVNAISLSPDGKRILTGTNGGIHLWDIQSNSQIQKLADGENIESVAFSPDSRWVFAGTESNGVVRIWETESGREVDELSVALRDSRLRGHGVSSIAVSGDGGIVISGDETGAILLWNLFRTTVYREFEPRLRRAGETLRNGTENPQSLAILGEWYAFRGICPWAIEFLEKAREGGAFVSSLMLARCYWENNDFGASIREFQTAIELKEAPDHYLALCLAAVRREHAANFVSRSQTLKDTGNDVASLEAASRAIAMYQDLARNNVSPGLGQDLANAYNNAAWLQLFNRSPKEATVLATKGLEVAPNDAMIAGNLAHSYLFDNQFNWARAIYLKYKD